MSGPLPVIIATWPRNAREKVCVQISEFQGNRTIDVRCWYSDAAGSMKPGKSGVTLGIRHLPELADAICTAYIEAVRLGFLTGEENNSDPR